MQLFPICEVQTCIRQMHGQAPLCAVESLVVEVPGGTSGGAEQPLASWREKIALHGISSALEFLSVLLPGFIGEKSRRSRLRCLFCFSAN